MTAREGESILVWGLRIMWDIAEEQGPECGWILTRAVGVSGEGDA